MDNSGLSHSIQNAKLLEAVPEAIIIINSNGCIVSANQETEKLFGYSRAQLLGKFDEYLLTARSKSKQIAYRKDYFSDPRPISIGVNFELFGLKIDGTEFPIEISLSPLDTDEGLLALAVIRDISERKKNVDAKAIFSAIVESSDDAIVGADLNGIIFIWNNGAEQLYSYSSREVIGKNIHFIFPPEQQNEFNDIIHRIKKENAILRKETLRVRKDGRLISVYAISSPIKNSQNKIVGVLTTARNITEQKQLAEQLCAKNIELEDAISGKDHFLASMSHELRTPLNAIIGFTGTLLMKLPGPLTVEQEKQLKIVEASAKHLLSIINDILDLAKIESGKVEIEFEIINCQEVIKDVAASLMPFADAKKIDIKLNLPAIEIDVMTDRRALTQILLNLLNNAINFTEKGYVSLELNSKKIGQNEFVTIDVIDTGIGIKEEEKEKLFKAFRRLGPPANHKTGTGLGLYLSKKLAALIKGEIEFESEYKKGSRFSILLPKKNRSDK